MRSLMNKLLTRTLFTLLILGGFFGPFAAVILTEYGKKEQKMLQEKEGYLLSQQEATQNRERYYADIAARKEEWQKQMSESQKQYEQLLKDQPDIVSQNTTQTTQTVTQPVVTTQTVPSQTTPYSPPKSSRKTKTS